MLDINIIRKEPRKLFEKLSTRGYDLDISYFEELEFSRKKLQKQTEDMQAKRNSLAKKIGFLKSQGLDANDLILESQSIPEDLKNLEQKLSYYQEEINKILFSIPNVPHASVPIGSNEQDNIEVRRWTPDQRVVDESFDYKDHVTVGEPLGLDFSTAAKMSGSRFLFMTGGLARLHRALSQFMLDLHINHGYVECYTPYIVNASALLGTGQLPKFKEEMFAIKKGSLNYGNNSIDEQYLISTSEITLVGRVSNSILNMNELPIKLTAHTPCFRSEAGSGGRDIKGMIRQHQFDKVELVQIVHPSTSYNALDDVLSDAERVLQLLELPYRVVLLCSGDMGFCSAKTYDLEVWLPSQKNWREISSVSNCEDFQARRMKARFRNDQGVLEYVHTINGSALAIGRTLVAILENYQQKDGSLIIPEVLRGYMNGDSILRP
ncbi:serine--tRNA ligase [Candidatus Kinetoplastidibacterium crithidiae]|uniref:Serine--tRNA ligase n=1 Tax=Candidatus Kinetoplastidibacterium crithidiae TCC036E TaxID=1208918 RepID=M1LQC4_9PROT|nr:serine--tRNA ligase [Candidatus Kinetoplastibacterium crithidii]AFZ82541.1 seryl-tRNA synthetase [Candidatus Kinetoplastibacterium crithidii (ex Angomonas deanei ATCC 30255)]AGF47797.1 seryl-tRNA synthetase [Candidatus Kinetoplastibacterium crithidii TCC036E]